MPDDSNDPRKEHNGWIGVDLDGTLAHYDHYRGLDHVGDPIEPMVKRVRTWLREGREVRLFTARQTHPAIKRWMKEHLGEILPITRTKDRFMQMMVDDRAVNARRNTGEVDEVGLTQAFEK